jgi:hypothetical protein
MATLLSVLLLLLLLLAAVEPFHADLNLSSIRLSVCY